MNEKILLALTREEWAKQATGDDETGDAFLAPRNEEVCVILNNYQFVGLLNRHGVAALALHGQPFGFAQEDVDTLLTVATESERANQSPDYYHGRMIDSVDPAWCRSLAARIAALLPPGE